MTAQLRILLKTEKFETGEKADFGASENRVAEDANKIEK